MNAVVGPEDRKDDGLHHSGRLRLIAGEQDPEVSDSFTAEEYLLIRKLIGSLLPDGVLVHAGGELVIVP